MVIKESLGDRIFNIINLFLLTAILVVILYPLLFVLAASVSDPIYVNTGRMWLIPRGLTVEGYVRVFSDDGIMTGYRNTIMYTVVGTVCNLIVTLMAAYALSKKSLAGRGFFMLLISFTMYFSGGLIPTYLLYRNLNMLNKFSIMIVPGLVNTINLIIARTFFANNVPLEMEEAAMIDGCSYTRTFVLIVLPLIKALIAVLALYYGVNHWNAYFNALIFITDRSRYPLQLFLREILIQAVMSVDLMNTGNPSSDEMLNAQVRLAGLIRYSVIIVSSLPIIIIYPFLQKYFAKGIMIGAIKG